MTELLFSHVTCFIVKDLERESNISVLKEVIKPLPILLLVFEQYLEGRVMPLLKLLDACGECISRAICPFAKRKKKEQTRQTQKQNHRNTHAFDIVSHIPSF